MFLRAEFADLHPLLIARHARVEERLAVLIQMGLRAEGRPVDMFLFDHTAVFYTETTTLYGAYALRDYGYRKW